MNQVLSFFSEELVLDQKKMNVILFKRKSRKIGSHIFIYQYLDLIILLPPEPKNLFFVV